MKNLIHKILAITVVFCFGIGISLAASEYKETEVKNGGSLSGTVTFSGPKPPSITFKVTKDKNICGATDRVFNWVKTNGKGLQDVVVFFEPAKMKKGKKWPKGYDNITVDQKKCEFRPLFQIMKNQQKISVKNSDSILHNLHTYELVPTKKKTLRKTVMNVSQSEVGSLKKKVKLKKGSVMKIECDAHEFMHANIFVAHNPYFAESGKKGGFSISEIPAGKYTVTAWHPLLGFITNKNIKIQAGKDTKLNFAFSM